MKILGLSGSPRAASTNTALLRACAELLPEGVELELHDYRQLPLFDPDLAEPPAATALKQALAQADAVLIATPEYNWSIPGVLKNALDWSSRPGFRSGWVSKPVGIVGTSPGAVGTARAQVVLRNTLFAMLAQVYPHPEVLVGHSGSRFSEGELTDASTRDFLASYLAAFSTWAARVPPVR